MTQFRVLLLVVLVLITCARSFFVSKHISIQNGRAGITEAPWQLTLLIDGEFLGCGAVIIDDRDVITAAHCVYLLEDEAVQVRAGSSRVDQGGCVYDVTRIVVHPKFRAVSNETFEYDIAYLRVRPRFLYSYYVNCITMADYEPENGKRARAYGWDSVNEDGHFQKLEVEIVDRVHCKQETSLSDTQICTSARDCETCIRDGGGGSLVVENKLAGLSLFNPCEWDGPDLYESIPLLKDWICQQMVA